MRFAALAIGTLALGLLVHQAGSVLPPAVQDILGDALWAMMIAWLVGAIIPRTPPWRRAAVALAFAWAVELSQLLHAPWLDGWRRTTLGQLTLGTDFDPRDLAAYAVGVLGAMLNEAVLGRGAASAAARQHGGT
jgi:hypothetical protein